MNKSAFANANLVDSDRNDANFIVRDKQVILQLSRVGFFGGVERMIVNIARASDKLFTPIIAVPNDGVLARTAAAHGIETRQVPLARGQASRQPAALLSTALQVAKGRRAITYLAKNNAIDLIHTHHPVTAFQAKGAKQKYNIPLILHVHETLPASPFYNFVMRIVINAVDHFICVSEASADLVRSYAVSQSRISLVYNGLDDTAFGNPDPAPDIRGPGPHIGIFGVLEPRKGQDIFLRACEKIIKDHPAAQLWIFGTVSFSETQAYADRLRTIATSPILANRVHFAGHRQDVPSLMKAMNVVVSASTGFESLPTVLLEAGAQGRPVVATDVGGVREIIEDGRTGFVVPPNDVDALAEAIGKALSDQGPPMGDAARVCAQERYTMRRFGLDIASVYQNLLRERPPYPILSHDRLEHMGLHGEARRSHGL